MCGLPDGVANSDVSDLKDRTEQYIDPALRYACMSWHMHLVNVDTTPAHVPAITPTLHQFLETKFLFWLEALSVLGAARNAVEALQATTDWLEVCWVSVPDALARIYSDRIQESPTLDLAHDCFRFVTGFFEIVSASSPHIYHSALVLAPQESIVRKLYGSHAHPFTRVVHGLPMSWDTHTAATTRPSRVMLAVWSPCNRFIAIAWTDAMTVDVLDSITLQRLQTLISPQMIPPEETALVFSPDSRVLTCSSGLYNSPDDSDDSDDFEQESFVVEGFAVSWELQTGDVASVIRWQGPEQHSLEDLSITYSADGKMLGVFGRYHNADNTNIFDISFFDVASGLHMHSHSISGDIPLSKVIWTYGESLRFVTADATTVTIWEVGFTSGATPTKIETFPAPENFGSDNYTCAQLLPTPLRLALAAEDKVLVWDARNSKYLLYCTDTNFYPAMSFSSDGRFFACSTTGPGIYLWKESPTGYILHEILASSTAYTTPYLSRNGESIVVIRGPTVLLMRTNSLITPSSTLARAPQHTEDFVLKFSPDGALAIVAMRKGNTVTILDLESGVPQLTIDAGMEVYGLGVIGNAVVVMGDREVITWNLPAGDRVPDTRVNLEDSSQRINLGGQRHGYVVGATISPDSHHIALVAGDHAYTIPYDLHIYNASTGEHLGCDWTRGGITPQFSSDGSNVWCARHDGGACVWRVRSGRKVLERLKLTVDIEHPPEGCSWGSSHGYRVTNDWWILDPGGKRLLMLPPPWQSHVTKRVWKGQFLALLHSEQSEPVILEVNP